MEPTEMEALLLLRLLRREKPRRTCEWRQTGSFFQTFSFPFLKPLPFLSLSLFLSSLLQEIETLNRELRSYGPRMRKLEEDLASVSGARNL